MFYHLQIFLQTDKCLPILTSEKGYLSEVLFFIANHVTVLLPVNPINRKISLQQFLQCNTTFLTFCYPCSNFETCYCQLIGKLANSSNIKMSQCKLCVFYFYLFESCFIYILYSVPVLVWNWVSNNFQFISDLNC